MEPQDVLPKEFLELFDTEIEAVFSEEQLSELANLPYNLKEVLQNFIRSIQIKHIDNKTNHTRLLDESEQKRSELEVQLQTEKKGSSDNLNLLISTQSRCDELEKLRSELSEKITELQSGILEKEKQWSAKEQDLMKSKSLLEAEQKDLSGALYQKNREIDRLTDEWKQLTEKLNETTKSKIVSQTLADDARSELVIAQNRESRLKNELAQTSQQVIILNQELQAKFEEILSVRKEKSSQLLSLQSEYDDLSGKLRHVEQSLEMSKKIQSEQDEQIETYLRKLKEAKDSQAVLEEQYRGELSAQEKLISLYKTSSEEAEKKVKEMSGAVDELQKLLNRASEAVEALRIEKDSIEVELSRDIEDRNVRIRNLEEELVNANQLLEVTRKSKSMMELTDEEIEDISPGAAAASKLIKSGMSLTQIYTEYAKLSNELKVEKEERRRTSECLEKVFKDLEDKAPTLRQLKRDHERSLEKIDALTQQLNEALEVAVQHQSVAEGLHRNNNDLVKKNERYAFQVKDLSSQVRMLLKELEEERGTIVHLGGANVVPDDGFSSNEVSSSSAVISKKLVTFRSIEELQQKNMQLLEIVRELSSSAESKENSVVDEKAMELQAQLNKSLMEIEEMKSARNRQAQLVESVIQQRDMYRMMVAQQAIGTPTGRVTTPTRANKSLDESHVVNKSVEEKTTVENQLDERERKEFDSIKSALKELQEEFTVYRKEKCEHEKTLNEQLATKSKDLSDFRLKCSKLEGQLEFVNGRFKSLQNNVESHKKEAELVKERNQKLSESMAKQQQTVIMIREELTQYQKRAAEAEVRCSSLQMEKEKLKIIEATLTSELESARSERHSRDVVLRNLESIQNNLERSEFETKRRLNQRIENLEKENAILRSKADDITDIQKSSVYLLERQLKDSHEELERFKAKCAGLEDMLKSSDSLVEHLRSEESVLQKKLSEIETKLAEKERVLESNELHQLLKTEAINSRAKLDQVSNQLKAKEQELIEMERHLLQYKEMAENLENSLKEQNEASSHFKETLEQQLVDIRQALDDVTAQNELLYSEKMGLEDEGKQLKDQLEDLMQEKNQLAKHALIDPGIVDELEKLKEELQAVQSIKDQALLNEQIARKDLGLQAVDAQQAHANYERELVLHAADVELLSTVKSELAEVSKQLADEKALTMTNKLKREHEKAAWIEKEQELNEKVSVLKEKLISMQNQNTLLHEELGQLSQKMLEVQKTQEIEYESMQTQASLIVDKETSTQKSSEQLFEVIRFLRREKEIAEVKFESLEAETVRLRKQSEHLKVQLAETEDSLVREREQLQVKLQTTAQQAEMLRKIESINVLQDSNQLLRAERDRISTQMREIQIKMVELDSKVVPLESKCADLESEREALQKEIELARDEASRWKSRTAQLIEQCSKFDPEEFKRAIEERDVMKVQLKAATDDAQKLRNEVSRLNIQVVTIQNELQQSRIQLEKTSEELTSVKSQFEADAEEKNKTIAQLRKIGRKYRMQAEEVQKELDELKLKSDQTDMIADLHVRLSASEQQYSKEVEKVLQLQKTIDDLNSRLSAMDANANISNKKLKDLEASESHLAEELNKLKQDHTQLIKEKTEVEAAHSKLVDEIKRSEEGARNISSEVESLKKEREQLTKVVSRTSEENIKLTEDVTKLSDENQKLTDDNMKAAEEKKDLDKKYSQARSYLVSAKKKMEDQKADIEKLSKENEDLLRKVLLTSASNSDLREKNCQDQQTSPARDMEWSLQIEETMQELNSARELCDRLQKENLELKQRMSLMQKEIEQLRKQVSQHTSKPILTAPPVERNILTGTPSDMGQRRANIRPMTCNPSAANPTHQQKYSTPVQPVRRNAEVLASTATMVASIRPMAVAQSQPVTLTTPMATVMPTALNVQENESTPNVILSQSVITSHQVMRPTQQVQPVSHTEESTVSSSGEPGGPSTSQEHAPLPAMSTASIQLGEGSSMSSQAGGPSGIGPNVNSNKRQREENKSQDDSSEHEVEAPSKRSKLLIGEAADTTQSAASACLPPAHEVEREAASRAQPIDAQQLSQAIAMVKRDSEPVTTSLEGHGLYNNQEDNSRGTPLLGTSSTEGLNNMATSDELPDYQDLEYDPTNSTDPTTSGQVSGEVDDNMMMVIGAEDVVNQEEDVLGEDEHMLEERVDHSSQRGRDDNDDDDEDDDVIFVEDDEKFDQEYQEINSVEYEEQEAGTEEAGQEYVDSEEREDKEYLDYDIEVKTTGGFDNDNYVQEDDDENSLVNLDDDDEDEEEDDEERDSMAPLEVLPPSSSASLTHEAAPQQSSSSSDSTPLLPSQYMRTGFSQPDNPQTSFIPPATSRSMLTSFSFAHHQEGYEIGDDGIVPSTPTNQFVFIEGTQSPHVDEHYPFREMVEDHSGLAQQGVLGMDQTHMDLLDFDEAASHDLIDQGDDDLTGGEGIPYNDEERREAEDTDDGKEHLDGTHGYEEQSEDCETSQQTHRGDDVANSGESSGKVLKINDKTSSESVSSDKHGMHAAQQKPKIQKIVWDEPSTSSSSVAPIQTLQAGPSSLAPAALTPGASGVQTRRGYHQTRGGRGGVRSANIIPLLNPEFSSPAPRRTRGPRGSGSQGGKRQHF